MGRGRRRARSVWMGKIHVSDGIAGRCRSVDYEDGRTCSGTCRVAVSAVTLAFVTTTRPGELLRRRGGIGGVVLMDAAQSGCPGTAANADDSINLGGSRRAQSTM